MSLWPILAVMTALVLALVLLPILRRPGEVAARPEHDMSVYRAQLRELEREAERGLLGPEEARAARLEVERRMLAADAESRTEPAPHGAGRLRWPAALVLLLALPALSLTLYGRLGRPELPASPHAGRSDRGAGASLGAETADPAGLPSVATMIARLEERVASAPDDLDGWLRLARAYELSQNPAQAAAAYERAVALESGDAELHAALAEASILAAGGVVTEPARRALVRALELEPGNPRARFYQGLALSQRGERQGALALWAELIGDTPADAPYLGMLQAQATALAEDLGLAPEEVLPDPAPAAIAGESGPSAEALRARELSPAEQSERIRGMVEGLAARLAEQPDDAPGWRMLARSYGVLGETAKAAEAAERAASLLPDDAGAQIAYAEALLALESSEAPLSPAAVDQLERVIEVDDGNPQALFWLGRAAAERGDTAQAAAYWRRLLAQIPDDAPQRAQLQALIDQLAADD